MQEEKLQMPIGRKGSRYTYVCTYCTYTQIECTVRYMGALSSSIRRCAAISRWRTPPYTHDLDCFSSYKLECPGPNIEDLHGQSPTAPQAGRGVRGRLDQELMREAICC